MSRNYLTPNFGVLGVPFWCTWCTWCTILVYLVYLVYHFGVPFWCTWCTWCTILVYHFGVLGVPLRVRHPLALPHNSPKTKPIRANPPPRNHGAFEKSPTKTPAGPDGPALVTPHIDRPPPAAKNHDGNAPHTRRGQSSTQMLLTTTPPRQDLRPRPNLKHHHAGGYPRQAQISSRGPNRTVLGHPAQTGNRQHKPARLNRQVEMSDPTHRNTRQALHAAAPIRSLLTITLQNTLTPSHGHNRPPPLHGPAPRAGPDHPHSSVPQTRAPSSGGPAPRAGPNRP